MIVQSPWHLFIYSTTILNSSILSLTVWRLFLPLLSVVHGSKGQLLLFKSICRFSIITIISMYSLYLHLNMQLCVYALLYLRFDIPYSLCIIYDRYSLRRVRGRPSTSSTPMIVVSIFINVVIAALFLLLLLLLLGIYCCAKLRFRPTVSVFSSAAGSDVSAIRAAPPSCPLPAECHKSFRLHL